jgi:hypothetical protein
VCRTSLAAPIDAVIKAHVALYEDQIAAARELAKIMNQYIIRHEECIKVSAGLS